ncbi:MAG: hypothetical protein EpisKO_04740 [Epibacterium sp.]|jgi:hypothetical protein
MSHRAIYLAARARDIGAELDRVRQALNAIQHVAQTSPGGAAESLEMVDALANLAAARLDSISAEVEAAETEYTKSEVAAEVGLSPDELSGR